MYYYFVLFSIIFRIFYGSSDVSDLYEIISGIPKDGIYSL